MAGQRDRRPARVLARGLGVRHAGRLAWALRDVDLVVEPGERVLVTGASGAGKSTLLTAVAGLLDPDSAELTGELTVDGHPPRDRRSGLGLLAQDPDSQLVMTRAGDDVAFGLENAGVPAEQIWPRVDAALAAVGFRHGRDRPTQALSGGEKQRLVLAGALVRRPGLLLLDEPTAQLDPDGAALVRSAVAQATADRAVTVLVVDHDAGPWLPLVDRVVQVGPDGVVEHGPDWRPVPRTSGLQLPPGGDGPVLLAAHAAGWTYRGAAAPALPPTDVELRAGRAVAVTGRNGTGKSTLALLLAGLRAPTTGRVEAADELTAGARRREPHRWRAAELVTRIGTVFQQPEHQFLTGRLRDELALGPLRSGSGDAAARAMADELLERLGLAAFADVNPFTLSGGQQRRLSVATALATSPRVLVLDEPTFGQDAATWRELVQLLAERRAAGCAVAVVTHDADLVDVLADEELRL
ncbi:ATP-binding cassette domain-containing protein [Modestobacter sp. I12A-02628]|uniref:ATP-binding cassette domain-containing protein n=1 Tax=Goekera deserti TaxID=2497753 RepID=A0A7K3WFN2_9ACTN|nr:ATP-binding cassette domain-containing protein [Goekera deserti]NDI49814.1 ATP-binding cassette domain-containing protein [Goekera deserti]NEL55176.1 ATP-binding cassette domain-containing protein [Goekera deserti]